MFFPSFYYQVAVLLCNEVSLKLISYIFALPLLSSVSKYFQPHNFIVSSNVCRDVFQPRYQSERNYSGPILYRQKRENNNLSSGMSMLVFCSYFSIPIVISTILLLYPVDHAFMNLLLQWRIYRKEQQYNVRDALRSLQLIAAQRYFICLELNISSHFDGT